MKGVVLADGLGTRLLPLRKIINKLLSSDFDRPMAFHSTETLRPRS